MTDKQAEVIIREIGEMRADMAAFQARLEERCSAATQRRMEHHEVLFGNGNPGLKSRLQEAEGRIHSVEQHTGLLWKSLAVLATSVLGVIVGKFFGK